MPAPDNLTTLLSAFAHGEQGAAYELIPLVYDELRRIAHRRRWQWHEQESPDTTSLVHEAYLRLASREGEAWDNRGHFFYFASVAIRNILVDHARHLHRGKRGRGWRQVVLGRFLDAGALLLLLYRIYFGGSRSSVPRLEN